MINGRYRDGWHTEREVELFQYGTRWSFALPQWFRDAISRGHITFDGMQLAVYYPRFSVPASVAEGGIIAYLGAMQIQVIETGIHPSYYDWRDRFTLIKLADYGPYEPSKTFDAAD